VLFEDGQSVKAGDILFVIDPRPYEAAVARAEANLASAVTSAAFAKVEFERAASIIASQAIPKRVYDERANTNRVANATVKMAEAALKQASLDLEHAHVKAPISGRASRAEITLGNLVQPGPGAPLLTTIVSNHSIYADFEVDEQTYIETIRDYANGRDGERRIPVQLSLHGDLLVAGRFQSECAPIGRPSKSKDVMDGLRLIRRRRLRKISDRARALARKVLAR